MARPEKEIPTNVPLTQRSLAIDLRKLRKESGLTISELAQRSHYSAAALSTAASGKSVPTWEMVEAFVEGCGYDGDMERWKRAHRQARRDAKGPGSSSEDTGENPLPRIAGVPVPRRWLPETPTVPAPAAPVGLLALVQQAREHESKDKRVTSVTSADHMHTALALCTSSEDVIELMNELITDKGLSIQELEERSKKHYQISNSTLTQVLAGNQLPTTEWLVIFLAACGLEEERTVMWHFTMTRIRIAEERRRQRQAFGQRSRRRFRQMRKAIVTFKALSPTMAVILLAWVLTTASVMPTAPHFLSALLP